MFMKKNIVNVLFLNTLFTTILLCKEPLPCESVGHHRIYFGPEFANVYVSTHIKDVHVKGNKNFWGLRLDYEFIKPWSFYAGFDYLSMTTSRGFDATRQKDRIYSGEQNNIYGDIDFRFGYTVLSEKFIVSPYAGFGLYALGTLSNNQGFHEEWAYWSVGFRSSYTINGAFHLGANFKLFQSFSSSQEFKNYDLKVANHAYPWGMEAGVPMIWKCNPAGTWTFQLEPYWAKLDWKQTQDIFGSKFLISVRF
jgi:hypothetical protein